MKLVKDDFLKQKRKKAIIILTSLAGLSLITFIFIYSFFIKNKSVDLPKIVRQVEDGVVTIITFDSKGNAKTLGTGFVFSESGSILTNRHVIEGANSAKIKKRNQIFQITGIIAEDQNCDLAIISLSEFQNVKWTPLKKNNRLPEVGEKIFVVGNPLGFELSVSDGIVSAIRNISPYGQIIQISAPISHGSSGSPVLNMNGEVIGIATLGSEEGQNLNFAIPIEQAIRLPISTPKALVKIPSIKNEDILQPTQETSARDRIRSAILSRGIILINKLTRIKDSCREAYDLLHEASDEVYGKGNSNKISKKINDATLFIKEELNKDSSNPKLHVFLAVCLYISGQPEKAINEIKISLNINSNMAVSHLILSDIYFAMSMKEEAVAALIEAFKIEPNDLDTIIYLAYGYYQIKNYKKALECINRAESLGYKEEANDYIIIADIYSNLSNHLESIRHYQKAIELAEMPGSNYSFFLESWYSKLIVELEKIKNWKLGIKYLKKAILKWPADPKWRLFLGIMLLEYDDIESAKLQLSELQRMNSPELVKGLSDLISSYEIRKKILNK